MFDLKAISAVFAQLEEERGISREKIIEAIEAALATAYKKEFGKKGQIIRCSFEPETGKTDFYQVKIVVDKSRVIMPEEDEELLADDDDRIRFNSEHHITTEDAKFIKKGALVDEEVVFPLETKSDFGRIAAQTAKQVIIQKIREAEKESVVSEYGEREGEIISGTVQRVEKGNIYLDMGRAVAVLPYEEQIPGERYRQGERVRAYLFRVDDATKGVFLKVSRSHPKFLEGLFATEVPEINAGTVEIKAVAREAGSRSKVATFSNDSHIDPVGSLVGQRGVRVSTVMSELAGEKIDIIEWSEEPSQFIEDSLSPAKVINVELDEAEHKATVIVSEDQQSLAIGKGGQNVRLAAKLTGWKIDIKSVKGEELVESDGKSIDEEVAVMEENLSNEEGAPIEDEVTEGEVEQNPEPNTEIQADEEITEEK
jgi:transcription termination/antitermination protein NusA